MKTTQTTKTYHLFVAHMVFVAFNVFVHKKLEFYNVLARYALLLLLYCILFLPSFLLFFIVSTIFERLFEFFNTHIIYTMPFTV
mmetsp:Transcript_20672/g.26330  ORF Transcript_20672/g.26330 Transcript_20672/m.26330 type:complete len:84 (-) Transcript_20672:1031-1282(-)